ncbi:MAG: GNAT family N-acetyltransferase [bacterium]|nr:GNAT family N-acetyltransferase [bacterium]
MIKILVLYLDEDLQNQVVGKLLITPEPDNTTMHSSYTEINPNYRRKGIATSARYQLFHAFKNSSITHWTGSIFTNNTPSIRMMKQFGWESNTLDNKRTSFVYRVHKDDII